MTDLRSAGDRIVKAALLILLVAQITSSTTNVKRNVRTMGPVNLPLTPGAVSQRVVDACVYQLNGNPLFFTEFGLLKRLALVLTKFGVVQGSGGIWNISDTLISQIIDRQDVVDQLATFVGINPAPMEQLDTSIPIVSALLMGTFIFLSPTAITPQLEEQAQWFSDYLGGDAKEFDGMVTEFASEHHCVVEKMDMWFLIDDTESVGQDFFNQQIDFISALTSIFEIGSDMVRVGLSTFNGVDTIMSNTTHYDGLYSTLNSISYSNTADNDLATALMYIANEFQIDARPFSEGVPRVAFVFADDSSQPVLAAANALRAVGVTVFAVGLTNYKENVLLDVASDPDFVHFFQFDNYTDQSLSYVLSQSVCNVAFFVPEMTPVDFEVSVGDVLYASVILPLEGSVGLTFEVFVDSLGILAFSTETLTPSTAWNEASIYLQTGVTNVTLDDTLAGLQFRERLRQKRGVDSEVCLHIAMEPFQSGSFQGRIGAFGATPESSTSLECSEIITIVFDQAALDELNASPGDILYVSQNQADKPEDVAANCQVVVGASTILRFNISDCNPELSQNFTGSKYQATFTVWRQPELNLSLPIQRYNEYCKTFTCVFEDQLLLNSLSIVPKIKKVEQAQVMMDGAFNLGTDLCTTSDCASPLAAGSQVFVPDDVYVKISLVDLAAGINNFYVIMTSCWATKDADPNSVPRYQLITNKMATGGDIMILRNSQSTYAIFKFESFVWTNYTEMEQTISVHCDVTICDNDLADCTMLRRRRRSLQTTGKLISSHQLQLRTHKAENDKCETMHGYCSDRCNDKEVGIECSCYEGRKLSVDGRTCHDNYAIKAFGNRDHQTLVISSNNDWMLAAAVFICAVSMSMAAYVLWTRPRHYK